MNWPHDHVLLKGPKDAPPLLLLHGFMGAPEDWLAVMNALPSHRCIAPALPGHAGAALPVALSHQRVLEGLEDLLDAQGVERCAVLGYSMGGRIAWQLALRSPQRVSTLIVESANPGIDDAAAREARARHDDALAAHLANSDLTDFLDDWYAQPLFATLSAVQKAQLVARRSRGNPIALAAVLQALSVGRQENLWPRVGDVACPVYLIAGEEDARYAKIANSAPGQAHIVPDVGHNVHYEAPAKFATLIAEILT
jgi:2-succinyl-6-hydroxy-2,4-cyclohexadiene-1-carboxylate synthase